MEPQEVDILLVVSLVCLVALSGWFLSGLDMGG
jgi:hypothetical protein